jgi:hypothetical protein
MNKQTLSTLPGTTASHVESDLQIRWSNPERSRRLIVLISLDSDCTPLTRRICRLASETSSTVQLLGLCKDPSHELTLRRELATVSALIRDAKVYVEAKVEIGSNWLAIIKQNYQEGDMIVCISDQPVGIRQKPLSQILESNLKAPIYILSETKSIQSQSNFVSQIIVWSGSIAIIIGFLMLQVKLLQLPNDWFQTVLSILLLIPELGLILLWNSLF